MYKRHFFFQAEDGIRDRSPSRGLGDVYKRQAQKVKQYTEDLKATDDFSDFDRLNQWMDADPRHRKLVSLMRAGMGGQSYAERNNAMQPRNVSGAAASTAVPEKSAGGRGYTDAELLENCLLYTSPSPRDGLLSRMPSSA